MSTTSSNQINQTEPVARVGSAGQRPPSARRFRHRRLVLLIRGSAGQATAEYALVMLAAAGLAGLLLAWATSTDGVARLMNAVLDSLISDAES